VCGAWGLACLKPAQHTISLMKGGMNMTEADSVMGRTPGTSAWKEGIMGRKPAPVG
jgi:hypothetical protein